MDIEKERELFEAWLFQTEKFKNRNKLFLFMLDENGNYEDTPVFEHWQTWQAAKAQAVPEGFVVLKTSDVREVLSNASDAMDAESPSSVFTQTGNPSAWYDHHLVAEKNILDAIKAQEPAND